MEEKWTVKAVDGVEEAPSSQEKEQQVLEQAAEQGEITPESAGIEDDGVIRINLDKPPVQQEETQEENATTTEEKQEEEALEEVQQSTDELGVSSEEGSSPQQEHQEGQEEEEVIELISQQEDAIQEQPVAEDIIEEPQAQQVIPEGLDNLVKFMDETGGTLEDYVSLNKSYDELSQVDLVQEYYSKKYPHYNEERLQRRMHKDFGYDEGDDPDVIQDRRDAFEDATFEAKKFLNDQKDKYYADLKFNRQSNLTPDQKEATEFYSEYKKNQEDNTKLVEQFQAKTDKVFGEDFKGFDFKVGDNKYRFKVSDVQKTKEYQSDLNNFIGDFAGEDGTIEDVNGYHKALFAAKNADKIAKHFYEQGRADAIKQSAKESKNIDMTPRGDASSVVRTKTGTQFKVVSGESSNGLRIKMRNK